VTPVAPIFTEEHKMFRAQRRFVDASGHTRGTATS